MSSSLDDVEQKTMTLSALVARRDAKRRQVEALGEEMQAIKRQMDIFTKELHSLDDEISDAERDLQQIQQADNNDTSQQSQRISFEAEELERNGAVTTDEEIPQAAAAASPGTRLAMTSADEFLTDPDMTATRSDEFLTEPTPTRNRQQEVDQEAREVECFYDEDVVPPPLPPPEPPQLSHGTSLMGQLQITTGSKTKKKKLDSTTNSHKKPAATATTNNGATLDHYFHKTTDVTPSSGNSGNAATTPNSGGDSSFQSNFGNGSRNNNTTRQSLDSLHALPQPPSMPQQQGTIVDRTAYTVARMVPQPEENSNNGFSNQLQSDNFTWSRQVGEVLTNVFGIESFRGHQKEIINCTMNGQDAFVIMRTGGGKSLCYQLPALLEGCGVDRKVTLVISPLLSLIKDQVDQMNAYSPESATCFTSKIAGGIQEHTRRWNVVRDRNSCVCLVFVTPEKVTNSGKLKSELQKLYNQNRLGRFVVDECHCTSQWGHDFRPDYTKLGILKHMFPDIPLIAMTATASDKVRRDVCNILKLGNNYQFFRSTANRPNLHYSVVPKVDGKDKVVDEMAAFIKEKHPNNAGIIYTFSRKEADDVSDKLCAHGIVARAYHSSVRENAKDLIHQSWMNNDTQVVVATIAFGLGINKPDVRFVLHHSLSKTLEAYYQESGRAGRDGKPADCILYYSTKDVARMLEMIHGESGEGSFWSMVRYSQAAGNDAVCRAIILSTLGEPASEDPEVVLDRHDGVTTDNRDVGGHAKTVTELVQFKESMDANCTIPQLVKEWRTKPENAVECVRRNPPGQDVNGEECSRIIVSLLIEDILHPHVVYNSKGFANMYVRLGPRAHLLLSSPDPKVCVRFPFRKKKTAPKSARKTTVSTPDADGWHSTKKRKSKASAKTTKRKRAASKEKKPKKQAKKKKAANTKNKAKVVQKAEVIELDDSSDDENCTNGSQHLPPPPPPAAESRNFGSGRRSLDAIKRKQDDIWNDNDSSESEYEFDY